MAEVPLDRRFLGSVRLVKLHLWRVAQSTDLEEGFRMARNMGMITSDHEAFIRECFALEEALSEGLACNDSLHIELVHELQMCAIRLNAADPA